MRTRGVRVRSARGYLLVDVAVGAVLSLVLAAALAPTVHEARMRGMDVGLAARLHLLRGAVWMFQADHNGVAPAPDRIEEQLLNWTDGAGNTSPSRTSVYLTSPYLRQIPALNVGSRAGARAIGPDDKPGVGWLYSAGVVRANTAPGERDARGVEFLNY